jgi:hypothetical protein
MGTPGKRSDVHAVCFQNQCLAIAFLRGTSKHVPLADDSLRRDQQRDVQLRLGVVADARADPTIFDNLRVYQKVH